MGQYYKPVIQIKNKVECFDTYLDGEYECCKLMEHSWYDNNFVNSIASMIYNRKGKIAWVGDYSKSLIEDLPGIPVSKLYELAWTTNLKKLRNDLKSNDFTLKDKFFINHDLKEYIDLNKYYIENNKDRWCTNPISLLTAIGNGLGGGDFYSEIDRSQNNNVGKWAWNCIEITDKAPANYKEAMYHFQEE